VTGSTVFGSDQFNPIVQPFEGRTLTLEQLREISYTWIKVTSPLELLLSTRQLPMVSWKFAL
jgi:hypothetical protein